MSVCLLSVHDEVTLICIDLPCNVNFSWGMWDLFAYIVFLCLLCCLQSPVGFSPNTLQMEVDHFNIMVMGHSSPITAYWQRKFAQGDGSILISWLIRPETLWSVIQHLAIKTRRPIFWCYIILRNIISLTGHLISYTCTILCYLFITPMATSTFMKFLMLIFGDGNV